MYIAAVFDCDSFIRSYLFWLCNVPFLTYFYPPTVLVRWSLAAFTVLYLLVGFLIFVFVPAVFFTWLENWNYREAVYYAFITLSTIGFGDFTAGTSAEVQ